jgi:hypothetical protein
MYVLLLCYAHCEEETLARAKHPQQTERSQISSWNGYHQTSVGCFSGEEAAALRALGIETRRFVIKSMYMSLLHKVQRRSQI